MASSDALRAPLFLFIVRKLVTFEWINLLARSIYDAKTSKELRRLAFAGFRSWKKAKKRKKKRY